jgi:hypothetical protein
MEKIAKIEICEKVSLMQMQKLMGTLNDLAIMCPFMKCFKKQLNLILGFLQKKSKNFN